MLIINADDLGWTAAMTDNSVRCYQEGRISSASILVFMRDSRRAAESAISVGLETGLHLNLDLPFDGPDIPPRLRDRHARIAGYFHRGKWTQVVYNPFLRKDFAYVFSAQDEEYARLFGRGPAQVDGHQHLHLCMNMVIDHIVPFGSGFRRNYTFQRGEKGIINRTYRRLIDRWLVRRYRCTDAFYTIEPVGDDLRLARIVSRAHDSVVELMVHPGVAAQQDFLMSERFRDLIQAVPKGTYRMLSPRED